jgi:hypothetical protein
MTKWKDLQDTNPEPSLLDAIAHVEREEDKIPDAHVAHMQRWANERKMSKRERERCLEYLMELVRVANIGKAK